MKRFESFGRDLVQDLRDRNLLIPAIVLVVAIIAVPIMLGSGGGSGGSTATAPVDQGEPASIQGSEEVDPVVLADVPGLRDYRKRLEGSQRNPFIQQDPSADSRGSGAGSSSGSGSSAGTSSATSSSTSSATSSGSVPSTDSGTSSGGTTTTTPETRPPETKLVKFTIDVRVGRVGEAKVLKDVDPLAMLPGNERPIVQYINSKDDGSKAGFVVSPYVLASDGDGKCDPGRNNCQYLWMEEGDARTFVYGDKHQNYRLELLAIHRKVVPVPNATG